MRQSLTTCLLFAIHLSLRVLMISKQKTATDSPTNAPHILPLDIDYFQARALASNNNNANQPIQHHTVTSRIYKTKTLSRQTIYTIKR